MIKKISILVLSVTLLASCSGGPENAVKNFTKNIAVGNITEAKKYATEPTGKILDFSSAFRGASINPDFKFEMIKDSIVGNTAWVTFINQTNEVQVLKTVKIDGDWLVHLDAKK